MAMLFPARVGPLWGLVPLSGAGRERWRRLKAVLGKPPGHTGFSSDLLGGCGLSYELPFVQPRTTPLQLEVPGGHPWGQLCSEAAFGL